MKLTLALTIVNNINYTLKYMSYDHTDSRDTFLCHFPVLPRTIGIGAEKDHLVRLGRMARRN